MDDNAAFGELSSLLLSFRDAAPDSHSVVIAEWVDLYEPIVALYLRDKGRADCEGVISPSGRATRLHVQRDYFRGRKGNVDSLIEFLWDHLGSNLTRAEFSFRDGRYAAFNSEDQAFIDSARRSGGE